MFYSCKRTITSTLPQSWPRQRDQALLVIVLVLVSFAGRPAQVYGLPTFNTFYGTGAGASTTTGNHDSAFGWDALQANTTGNSNTACGADALYSNTSGHNNTATGGTALYFNTTGHDNTATGITALSYNQTGFSNTASGSHALQGNTTGWYNTGTGDSALSTNQTGNWNTAAGAFALYNNTANYNAAFGASALQNNTTGTDNTASGLQALFTNSTGYDNTANGFNALYYNTRGHDNTAMGFQSLNNNTTGNSNVALGMNAGFNLTTGSNNIVIGAGVTGIAGEANKIRIGKSTHTATYIGGIYNKTVASGTRVGVMIDSTGKLGTVVSSARFKEAIKPMDKSSETILRLKPVTFRYKKEFDPDGAPQFGLIAEDVEEVNSDLVVRDEEGKVTTVRYEAVNAMLLNEFLKERRRSEEQRKLFETRFAEQQKQIEALAATVQKVSSEIKLNKSIAKIAATNQ